MCCIHAVWDCGSAIMEAIRWLKAVWDILAASPRQDSSENDSTSIDFVPDAALVTYLENHPEPIAADSANLLPSNALPPDVSLLVPLVSSGRLVGLLTLGAPNGSKTYSSDQLMLVATLAGEAAAAVRIAQLSVAQTPRQLTVPRGR